MAIDWIYDTTYVSFGVEWNAAYKAVGKVTIQPVVYRWDRYNTADGSKFSETLRYEPNGSTGSWSNIGWGSGSGTRSIDPFSLRTYQRQASAYTVQLQIATDSGFGTAYDGYFHTIGEVTRTATYTVPALPPAFNTLTATRVSDNQVNLSWTAASGNIKAVCIERSVDGGSYSEVAVIWNASATSWQDNATTADHSYTYRARYHHEGAYGAYSNTVTVTMTPSAPQTITTAAAGGINIDVTLTNPSPVATKVQYEVSTDDGSTWGATQDSASLTFFSVSASGTVKIRARNVYDGAVPALVSDWLTSDTIVTICPPDPPTLLSPSTNVINMSDGSVTFEWVHNAPDRSAQTAAQLDYEDLDDEDASDTKTINGDAQSYNLPISDEFSVGDRIKWRMRTKGADASYGEWSGYRTFTFYTAPTLNITSPSATVEGMPIALTATYSDMAGYTCNFASVKLTQNGREVYPNNPNKGTSASGDVTISTVGGVTTITASLTTDEFLPTNGESYTVVLTARSSSGLSTSANATFTVDFVEPQAGELQITNDPDTGYASLLATFDNHATDVEYSGATNAQFESTEGYVRSLTVEGKSQKWQQLLDPTAAESGTKYGVTLTKNADGTYTVSGTATQDVNFRFIAASNPTLITGNKYLFLMCPSGGSSSTFYAYDTWSGVFNDYGDGAIGTGRTTLQPVIRIKSGYTINKTFRASYMNLTAIYGAGNEPTAVTDPRIEWLKAYALAHPAYDAGSLVSIEGVSVGDGTITTPLRSAGSVHDTLTADADSWTVERRVGVVDLGTLTWTYSSNRMRSTGLANIIKIPATTSTVPNILAANKRAIAYASGLANNHDGIAIEDNNGGVLLCYAESAADSPTGLMFYELATPTQDPETSMDTIEIGSAFTVATDLDSTFEMTTWDGSADAESISLSRVNADGSITPLLTDGASGSGLVDRYAPLNTPYKYAVTTTASSQAVKTVYVDNELVTDLWFVYWTHRDGDTVTEMTASAKWNPDNGGIQVTRPSKTRVYYAGRRDPVSYDGHAVALTETPSWMFIGKDEVDVLVKLIEDGGRGVYKSCDGWVYHADFDLTLTPSYTAIGYYGGASLGITRIAGDRL